jgi:5-methyltetrahydrofolate--homocysteine methyltransferase
MEKVYIKENRNMDDKTKAIYDAILEGDRELVKAGVREALDAGVDASALMDTMTGAMGEVGRLFEEGEYFVPEMLVAARAMQEGMEILKPHLLDANVKAAGLIVAGTVKGDLHDIGKNLVCMMLEGAGFQVIDLGADVDPDKFVSAVREHKPDIVAMSALLTTTMPNMKVTLDALQSAGLRDQVKIMVGGAPVTDAYCQQIGANGYSPDASRAVKLAKSLVA